MKRFLSFIILLLPLYALQANPASHGVIKGIVTDQDQAPVPYAPVMLKVITDSVLYKGELSNEKGEFLFEHVKEGNYFIEIRAVGFETFKKTVPALSAGGEQDLGIIRLKPAAQQLQGVTIQGDKPFIERQVDRTVVNIENSAIHQGASVSDVMEKLPGVLVNQDGLISLKGKQGVIIMVDGKPAVLSGQDLSNMLKGMPSSNLQKIEIITNPSSKYDASGNAGIINIVTKKNRREGFNGSISTGYGQGRYEKSTSSFNLSIKDKWYNIFMNYSFSHRKGFNNLRITRKFFSNDTLNTVFLTNNYIVFPFNTHTPRLGADFYLSKKTSLSVLGSGFINHFNPSANNHTDILNGNASKTSSYNFTNRSKDRWYNYAISTRLLHQLDTAGRELSMDLDYATYWNNTDQVFTNALFNAQDQFVSQSILIGDQDGDLKIYSAKADYVQPLQDKLRFETGWKSSYVTADNDIKFYNKMDNNLVFDSTRSNHFIYTENINAAYVNLNKGFKKISYQLGLRTEHTLATGEQLITGQRFKRNYVQLFPSLFVDYKMNDVHGLNASIGRRVDRPAYQQMNPFRRLIDATTYGEGNPLLLPQLTYNTELTYSFKNTFFTTLGYSLTTDNITDVLIQDDVTRTTIQTVVNLARFNYYHLNLAFTKKLASWWNTNTSLLSYYGVYTGTINRFTIDQGIPSFNFNTSNSFPVREGLSFEAGFIYNYKSLYGVTTIRSNYNLSLGIQKSLFRKQASLNVNASDLLWRAYPSGITHFGNVDEFWTSKRDTRVVNVNFTYRFGKGQTGKMRRSTGADDEKKRTGIGS